MTTIHLIRHGQASIGTSNYDVLSALGRRQARVLSKYFNDIGAQFDHAVSGTLARQIDTANIALHTDNADLPRCADFNEYQHTTIFDHYAPVLATKNKTIASSVFAGCNTQLTYEVFAAVMMAWAEDHAPPENIESWDQFRARIRRGLTSIVEDNRDASHIAIFTSGGVICTVLQMILNFPTEKLFEINWGIYNASITTLKTQQNGLKISTYNNISHLVLENDSALITNI